MALTQRTHLPLAQFMKKLDEMSVLFPYVKKLPNKLEFLELQLHDLLQQLESKYISKNYLKNLNGTYKMELEQVVD